MEIITGSLDPNELVNRFSLAIDRHREMTNIKPSDPVVLTGSNSTASEPTSNATVSPIPNVSAVSENSPGGEIPLEERIERARRIAAAKQQKKLAEEAEVCVI